MDIWQYFFPKNKKVIIWGAGENGKRWFNFLGSININVNYFIDKYNYHTNIYGVKCYKPEDILSDINKNDILLISPANDIDEIYEEALKFSFDKIYIGELLKFIPQYKEFDLENRFPYFGHFYSLYPSFDDVENNYELKTKEDIISNDNINLNVDYQVDILHKMNELYDDIPNWESYNSKIISKYRYRIDNPAFCFNDAVVLYSMIRLFKPKKLIEVGSGYSSAVTIDTREFYVPKIDLTFIEPYPKLLHSLTKDYEKNLYDMNIYEKKLQDIPLEKFKELDENDILFIDSTHVIKYDSDVQYLFFKILPILKNGVIVHLHDIFYPWEYPKKWILKGMGWNELYVLRAFLQNNNQWRILFFNSFMEKYYRDEYNINWKNKSSSASFWMQKYNNI